MDFNTRLLNDFNKIKKNIKNEISPGELIKKRADDNFYLNKVKTNKQIADYKNEYERIYDSVVNDPEAKDYLKLRFKQLYDELNRHKINTLLYPSSNAVEMENKMQNNDEIMNEESKNKKIKIKNNMKEELLKIKQQPITDDQKQIIIDKFNEVNILEDGKILPSGYKKIRRLNLKTNQDFDKQLERLKNRIDYLNNL